MAPLPALFRAVKRSAGPPRPESKTPGQGPQGKGANQIKTQGVGGGGGGWAARAKAMQEHRQGVQWFRSFCRLLTAPPKSHSTAKGERTWARLKACSPIHRCHRCHSREHTDRCRGFAAQAMG